MTRAVFVRLWGRVVLTFILATCAQVLMYAPLWHDMSILAVSMRLGGEGLYIVLVLFFFFGPAVLAVLFARHMIRQVCIEKGAPPVSMAVVIALAIASCYGGVLISFNRWGT